MVLWSVHVRNTPHAPLLPRASFPAKIFTPNPRNLGFASEEEGRFLEIRVSNRSASALSPPSKHRSLILKAQAKKNRENSSPEGSDRFVPGGDDPKGNDPDGEIFDDNASPESKPEMLDWREVRASLFRKEQAEKVDVEARPRSKAGTQCGPNSLGLKWAHPITVPETGCVLVATEKLDGVHTFERTVILLLRSGTRHPLEGPFGVVINRPLPKKMKQMKPTNVDLATVFGDCSLHFGGPLEASMFLVSCGKKRQELGGLEEVVPGLCFGARNRLGEAAGLVKKGTARAQDFRFFVGYAGWQLEQLREEIESGYWFVVSCSSNLISEGSVSSDGLWYEILQLMGGRYSELSRKPKKDV